MQRLISSCLIGGLLSVMSFSTYAQRPAEEAISDRFEKTLSGQYISTIHVDDVSSLSRYVADHPEVEVLYFNDGMAKIISDNNPRLSLFSYFHQNLTPQSTTKTQPKFTSNLQSLLLKSSAKSSHDLVLTVHRDSDLDIIAEHLEQAGLARVSDAFAKTIRFQASTDDLSEIVSLAEVAQIDVQDEVVQPLNYEARILQRNSVLYADASVGGYDLTGAGVTIGIGDGGELGQHIDFGQRVINQADGTYSSFGAHGDHVAGIVGASGALNPRHRGVAPGSNLITQKTTQIIANAEDYYDAYGMTLTNNSYGVSFNCETNGSYNYNSVNLDYISRMNPKMLHVFAAGNNGTRSCEYYPDGFNTLLRNYQSAKNVLTVGAVGDNRQIANISARGPAADGRIKPEIVASGMNIMSTGNNLNYFSNNGTSMAAPALTATLALLSEQYVKSYGEMPDGALLKAIACNSADDLGNVGPDYTYGFGMVNARKAIETITEGRLAQGTIENGNNGIHLIEVPNGVQEVKVLLYWHDTESTHQATKTLVNDLDLRITDAAQVDHLPWILNTSPAHVATPATKGVDDINNIEQISITDPAAGTLRVTVDGSKLPFATQSYSLVYEFIRDEVVLTHPKGNEIFTNDNYELISWDAPSTNDKLFKLSYSNNGGASWITLMNNISADQRSYAWNVPTDITEDAIIKVAFADDSSVDESASFKIRESIASFEVTPICEGMVEMNWNYAGDNSYATSVIMIDHSDGTEINVSNGDSYIHEQPLSLGEEYWFAVDHAAQTSHGSTRTLAQMVIPEADLTCPWTDDIKLTAEPVSFTGRAHTETSTLTVQLPITLKNIGSNDLDQPTMNYFLNGDKTIAVPQTLGSGESYTANLIETLRNLPVGRTTIDVYTPADRTDNNDLREIMEIRMLANEPIALPFTIDPASLSSASYGNSMTGISEIDRVDYIHDGNGEMAIAEYDGEQAMTLQSTSAGETNQYVMTFNLNGMTVEEPVYMQFALAHTGSGTTTIEIRGSDQDEWITINQLTTSSTWHTPDSIAVSEVLSANDQYYTSSTQVRFSQSGVGTFAMNDFQLIGEQEAVEVEDDVAYENVLSISADSDGQYMMTWFNNTEADGYQYEIQYATDSVALVSGLYQVLETVQGQGANETGWTYENQVESLDSGQIYFFRIKTTDDNGDIHYSNVVRIETDPIGMLSAEKFDIRLQNLVAAEINYTIALPSRHRVTTRLMSASGAMVYEDISTYDGGEYTATIPDHVTDTGLYFLEVGTAAERITKKVVVR